VSTAQKLITVSVASTSLRSGATVIRWRRIEYYKRGYYKWECAHKAHSSTVFFAVSFRLVSCNAFCCVSQIAFLSISSLFLPAFLPKEKHATKSGKECSI
jgi:hypothetical protein